MSLFCESSSELTYKEDSSVQDFSYNIFSNILQSKDGIMLNTNQFILKVFNHQDKVVNGVTHWLCSHQSSDFSIRVSLQLKNIKKPIEKRMADTLNKQFKFAKLLYQKPKMTLSFKFCMSSKPNCAKLFQKQINQITIYLDDIIFRIKELQREHEKFEPYIDLYTMRECFQFNRSSRAKSSKISLKCKRNKNVTQVMKLLAEGDTTLGKLQSLFIELEIKKFEEQKGKIISSLEQLSKNKNKTFQQSILTSIDIIKIENEKVVQFANTKIEDQLSLISTALFTFRKEITIHKENKLQSLSNEIFTETLVKKKKSQKGAEQFQNQTRLLTHLKGTFHPHIAEYYCKLEELPFKSETVYIRYYDGSLSNIRHTLSSDKKLKILHQISKVLNFLNYRRICHRDLKLDNVMVDKDLSVKLIDWGSVCPMYTAQKDLGGLNVKSQALYSTQGYFQRFYEDVFHQPFGKHYTKEQIEKGQFFDLYSFGFIIQKVFDLKNSDFTYWLDLQMQYMSHKCREKNPADRLSAIEVEIYLTLLRKKLKKFKEDGQSSPISSVA